MSEEFKNEFDENKETETDNVNTQEETETVFEDNASKPEETTNESAVTQEPGNAPTPENPVYARAYQPHEQREATKEEWYQEAQQEQKQQQSYNAYQFTAPESKKPNRSGKKLNGQGRKFGTVVATAVVFGLVASAVFQGTNYVGSKLNPQGKKSVQVQSTQTISQNKSSDSEESVSGSTEGTSSVSQVAQNAMPSIVSIVGVSVQEIPQIYQYFGYGQQQETQSSGSGIIVGQNDTELLIATNNHVVSGTNSLTVCFTNQDGSAVTGNGDVEKTSAEGESGSTNQDGQDSSLDDVQSGAVSAQIKGTDADNDLAVISVKLEDIPEDVLSEIKVATIGDSDSLQMGEQVVAIGNALGYGQSVTSGYVSALNRQVSSDDTDGTFIQTDAAINPGNSGGALLNMKGELIGINSAKIASDEVEGMGFAIPISKAEPILDEMMNQETRYKVEDEDKAAYIGITCENVTSDVNQMYGIPQGVYVDTVVEGGPAEKAGIKKGDVITKIDGTAIDAYKDLVDRLEYYEAGETVELEVYRAQDGEYNAQKISVTLGAKKNAPSTNSSSNQQQNEKNNK
ncbi:S1C family serine protease [Blautia stercoris]|uniref:Trypsin-like peptidase domain-containing protein n=1 Tax=Blautia stercoris TaxID=871664 RepID=A0ABR7P9F8_9FIRM|nr:trypsin-like peptidase domain-containing protein [Blautia stercoris]MBC8627450.1 trypsin-like peptidase domain-containing protein [Blautia stercoris]